ncbi:hypothetical protein D3C78_871730 [compost metagenome]
MIERSEGDHRHPAQGAGVYVANGPVGVVRQGVDGLDCHHWPFEGRHAVERQREHQKAQDRIGAQLMPGTGQGHHAVDHATPARGQEDQRHGHAQRLRPVGQGGVVQVVWAGPDVQGNQRPEVHNRQAIGVHRPANLLGHEVIHHAEKACGEEKAHGVMAVPPLDHGIGGAGIHRVGFEPADRDRQVVDHVQHRDHHDEGPKEPVSDIDVLDLAAHQGGKEHDAIRDPDDSHPHRTGELDLGIFLGSGQAQRQADQHDGDGRLPAPERESGQLVAVQAYLAGALDGVVTGSKLCAAGKTENHQAGVQGAQAAKAGPRQFEVKFGPDQLRSDPDPHRHPEDAPEHRHDDELADHLVVVGLGLLMCAHG